VGRFLRHAFPLGLGSFSEQLADENEKHWEERLNKVSKAKPPSD